MRPMAEMVLLNPLMVRQAHAAGRQVFVWFGMLENPFMFKAMRFFGADGLMSNDHAHAEGGPGINRLDQPDLGKLGKSAPVQPPAGEQGGGQQA